MPIFEYRCGSCGLVFERFTFAHGLEEDHSCPKCGATGAEKIISPFSSMPGYGSGGCGPSGTGFT